MSPPRFRLTWPLVFGVIAVMLLSGAVGSVTGAPLSAGISTPSGQSSAAATQLAAATASLAAGQGPAAGQPLTCSTVLGGAQASCSSASPSGSAVASQKWESESSPVARAGAAMTYDGKDLYVVLFGGFNGSAYLSDTWEFSHGMWVQLSPVQSPSARANATMAYDPVDKYMVLFGGYDGTHTLGDTWKFVGGAWTQLSPATSPSARMDSTMSDDAADEYLVLFGGSSESGPLGDTRTFDSETMGSWRGLLNSALSPLGAIRL